MDPRAGLNRCGKSLPPPGFDPRTVKPIAQSLYRLSYPGSRYFYENGTGSAGIPQGDVIGFLEKEGKCN